MLRTGRESCQASSLEFQSREGARGLGPPTVRDRRFRKEHNFSASGGFEAPANAGSSTDRSSPSRRLMRGAVEKEVGVRGARPKKLWTKVQTRKPTIRPTRPRPPGQTSVEPGPSETAAHRRSVRGAGAPRTNEMPPKHDRAEAGAMCHHECEGKGVDVARTGQLACPGLVRARTVAPRNRSEAPDDS